MARTWYIDHTSGNANYSGDSFTLDQQGTDCSITGTTLTVTGGGLTGKAGRSISVNNAGTYRVFVIASVTNDTTATLSALDTIANVSNVQYYIGGAWKGLASVTAVRVVPPDAVRCKKSPDPTSLGANKGTWTDNSNIVTLDTAVTAVVDSCDVAWTAGTNVTQAQSAGTAKEPSGSGTAQQFTTNGSFTTGKIAGHAITPGTLAAYQQICFWIRANTTALALGDLELRLKAGATLRHTITVPAVPQTALWQPVVVDTGGALAADIDTIELWAIVNQVSKVIILDNVFAAKASSAADSLTLNSLISKSSLAQGTTVSEGWYAIDSITGTTVVLRRGQNSNANAPFRGYSGATERVTLFKRECHLTAALETPAAINGTSGSAIAYEGGWADNTTQDGETWLLMVTSTATNVLTIGGQYNSVNRFGVVGGSSGITMGGANMTATNLSGAACNASIITISGNAFALVDNLCTTGGAANGVNIASHGHKRVGTVRGYVAASIGVNCTGSNFRIELAKAENCGGGGIQLATNMVHLEGSTRLNATAGVLAPTAGNAFLRNFTINEALPVSFGTVLAQITVSFENFGGVAGDTRMYSDNWLAQTDTLVHHGAVATQSWKMQPQSATVRVAEYPGRLPLATIAVNANATYTITGWFARNNSGLTAKLVCLGGQLAGISMADITSSMTVLPKTITGATNASPIRVTAVAHGYTNGDAAVVDGVVGNTNANRSVFAKVIDVDTLDLYSDSALTQPIAGNAAYTSGGTICKWEQLSVAVTPTEKGVIQIEAQAYGGATNKGWVSDLAVVAS